MKRYISLFSVFVVIFSFTFTAFSFEIDGSDTGVEWENAESVLLFLNEESNNETEFGALMWSIDGDSLYLCFNYMQSGLNEDDTMVGVAFSIDDSEFYTITAAEPVIYDSEKYRVEGAMALDLTKGATCEARVGFKHGIPDDIDGKVRFIDSEGSYSNIYHFIAENETHDYFDDSYYEKNTTKTTKPKTTKASTTTMTNVTTTTASTTKSTTVKTTKAKTTKSSKTTKKSDDKKFNPFDLFKDDESTEKTDSKRTTKNKTTKKAEKSVVTSIKIIEKEVYITEKSEKNILESEESAQFIQDETTIYTDITTPQGKKYQMLTAIAAGVALLSVSILGTLGANSKAKKNAEKDKKSSAESESKDVSSSD